MYSDFSEDRRVEQRNPLVLRRLAESLTDQAIINQCLSTSIGRSLLRSSNPDIESNLLSYFVERIGPSCSLSSSHNPYLRFLIPMCFLYPTLKDALLAVAANQLRLLGDMRFEKEAVLFKDRALQGLQRLIAGRQL